MSALLTAWLWMIPVSLSSQTFSGSGGIIPNTGIPATFQITLSGFTPASIDTLYGLQSVCIYISHTATKELRILLIAPDGEQVLLTDCAGGDGDHFANTCFNDNANQSILRGVAPFIGNYRPIDRIGDLNNRKNPNGVWKLRILDTESASNFGFLHSWSVNFGSNPCKPFPFHSSNLPLILIDTYGEEIIDDPKIMAGLKIISNSAGILNHPNDTPAYQGYIGIEIRGSSSQSFPKKSFGFETWDATGNEIDVSLLGMPAQSDWILNANYSDKTLMRNALAYQIWQDMGHYATRYRFVEVFLNNRYRGVYLFSEKIKRDKNRVDVAKMTTTDNSGDKLTGGYIIKIDKQTGSGGDGWKSKIPPPVNPNGQFIFFQYEYPKAENITPEQKLYIQAYTDSFEVALQGPNFTNFQTGWRKYAVESTFVDFFIVNEFSKNVDGYRLSTFLHKQRNSLGGKLRMGPVWDYDLAWSNANYCSGNSFTGWGYKFPCTTDFWQVPFWWQRLMLDPVFTNTLKCRWSLLRTNVLSNISLNAYIENIAATLHGPQQRNFAVWDIIGTYVWPNPAPFPVSYPAEISSLKAWIANRLTWLDANIPGTCQTVGSSEDISVLERKVNVFPNPTTGLFSVELQHGIHSPIEIFLYNTQGAMLLQKTESPATLQFSLDIGHLPAGVYHLILKTASGLENTRILKISGIKK